MAPGAAGGTVRTAARLLRPSGLILRGGLVFPDEEAAPVGPFGRPARSVLLVGQAGAAPWPHFLAWRAERPDIVADPLDAWSREVIGTVAGKLGARAISPNDRPYQPFQQWAMRAEGLKPSPLGILMHPEYGLWHAYRGALLLDEEIDIPPPREAIHLCRLCDGKPCLNACPVEAHSETGFRRGACLDHVRSASGPVCRGEGCLARNACPYGTRYRYPAPVQAFHMAAFAGL